MSVNEKVLDAIELLTKNSVQRASYDRTIQAQVLSCEDSTIGKYRCRYQDAIFYAYSSNLDVTFSKGSEVYILVPGNDMSKEKTILGTTNKLGINFISQAVGDEAYDIIGRNCIQTNGIYYLNSDNKQYLYTIYKYSQIPDEMIIDQNININVDELQTYIQQSSSIVAGASFKTSLDEKKQHQGSFGIIFRLCFVDNATQSQVIRTYVIDEDSMSGVNPYQQERKTRQYQIFNIDGQNFKRIQSIEIFNRNFPDSSGELKTQKILPQDGGDIEISDIELLGANRMTETELNGIAISFLTPEGTSFIGATGEKDYKTITAQIRVKGKLLTSTSNLPFFWGRQDISISPNSQYYNKHLGRGWRCLNSSNIIQQSEGQEPIVEWIPSRNKYVFRLKDATAKYTRIKVAVIYNDNVIVKTLTILRKTGVQQVSIESDGGTRFYFDIGHPTLTCKINGEEQLGDNYKYYWGHESFSSLEQLEETSDLNDQYNEAVIAWDDIQIGLTNGSCLPKRDAEKIESASNTLASFDYIQRVKRNKIYDLQIKNITSFDTFKCSVFKTLEKENGEKEDTYLGTAAITLTNSLTSEGEYNIVINNGQVVFQYDEEGDAPTSSNSTVQQVIKALSFTLYDNLGNPIEDEVVQKNAQWWWEFPVKDTMLTIVNQENDTQEEQDEDIQFKKYYQVPSLMYGISNKYRVQYQNNQVKLFVKYKDMVFSAATRFTFIKQGDPGTNGTEYITRIVPNTMDNNDFDGYPTITRVIFEDQVETYLNYKLKTYQDQGKRKYKDGYYPINLNASQLFKVEVWKNGEELNLQKDINITSSWEILKNKDDNSNLIIPDNEQAKAKGQIGFTESFPFTNSPADIVKCTVEIEDKKYYATMPVIITTIYDDNYHIYLKPSSGFRYAVYSNDGMKPQYANIPFEIICQKKFTDSNGNEFWEDVSTNNIADGSFLKPISYEFTLIGSLEQDFRNTADDKPINYFYCSPMSRFDGFSVTNAIVCDVYQEQNTQDQSFSTKIGSIHIPIHLLLNKFGLSALNDWDGNSIQIKDDDDGGSNYILSPQMGAGTKNESNEFTGVLMGQVKNVGGSNKSDVGLFGYADGVRSFFLNSENGSAIFGKANAGQVVIDPSGGADGFLYSGNFWKNYDKNTGLPSNYTYKKINSSGNLAPTGNASGDGLLINLSEPEIFFGSGHFYVTKEGHLHASGGGDIAGWAIGSDSLNSQKGSKIYTGNHNTLNSTSEGFYLSHQGFSIGSKFYVSQDGVLRLGAGAVTEANANHWTITAKQDVEIKDRNGKVTGHDWRSYIKYGTHNTNDYVYIGTDGFKLGTNFSVNSAGELIAASGKIGKWHIDGGAIYWGTKRTTGAVDTNKPRVSLGSDGHLTGPNWRITPSGQASFTNIIKLSGSSGGRGFSFPGATFNAGGSNAFGGPSSFTANMNVTAHANFSGSVKLPGTVQLGTWDLSKSNIRKLIIDEIQAHKITADQINVLYNGSYMSVAQAIGALKAHIDATGSSVREGYQNAIASLANKNHLII